MTDRGYQAALRLSRDPGATPAERENAAARCREHEAAQAKAQGPTYTRARVFVGGIDFSTAFSDIHFGPRPFYEQPRRAEPPPPSPRPKIVRVSADDIKRYGTPLRDERDEPPRIVRPSKAERQRYS